MIKFGTGGFRGVIGDDFVKSNIQTIAEALSKVSAPLGNKPLVIGYDNRFMSDFAAKWFAEVCMAHGIKVYLTATSVPTPLVMMATRDKGFDFGVMVTASHNPYIFNGVKVFTQGGVDADVSFTSMLEKKIAAVKEIHAIEIEEGQSKGLFELLDYLPAYIASIESFLSPKAKHSPLKVLFNNMNGVGMRSILPIAKDLDIAEFDSINTEHDAFFSFCDPNPAKQNIMGDFRDQVVAGGYDFGMATDSDADRLGIVDEKGNYVDANEIMACLYDYLVTYRGMKGDIVKNVATSTLVDDIVLTLGAKCHTVDVGFKNISAGIKEYDALLGGESSGGLTVRGYLFGKDSSFSSSLFLEMVIVMGKKVSEIVQEVKRKAGYVHVFLEDFYEFRSHSEDMLKYVENHTPEFSEPLESTETYGDNVIYKFSARRFALIRLSGTEPKFRLFAEMGDEKGASEAIETLKKYLEKADQAASLA